MGWGFDIDIGKSLSRALGIGEETLPSVVTAATAAYTGDYYAAATQTKSAIEQEKARKKEKNGSYTMYEPSYSTVMESGGTIDVPSQPSGVYEGYAGALTQIGTGIVGGLVGALRGPVGQAIGGAATGYAVGQALSGDSCGCAPKAFIRFNKCGEPIITRAMKKKAIAMVNCSGPEMAAATLGIDLVMLNQVISKQFPPRRMGISGAQLATTMRTARKLDRAHNMMQNYCKKSPVRRTTRSR